MHSKPPGNTLSAEDEDLLRQLDKKSCKCEGMHTTIALYAVLIMLLYYCNRWSIDGQPYEGS